MAAIGRIGRALDFALGIEIRRYLVKIFGRIIDMGYLATLMLWRAIWTGR